MLKGALRRRLCYEYKQFDSDEESKLMPVTVSNYKGMFFEDSGDYYDLKIDSEKLKRLEIVTSPVITE